MSQPLLGSLLLFLLKSHGQQIHHNVGVSLGSHDGQGIDPVDPLWYVPQFPWVFIPEYIDSERLVQYLPFHLG
jgi:hypothetical protein